MTCDHPSHPRDAKLAGIVLDLDRCPHGRHEGDACAGWRGPGDYDGGCRGGISLGNPLLPTGARIGFTIGAQPIVVPSRDRKHLPEEWIR